jgi:hypothetical protein
MTLVPLMHLIAVAQAMILAKRKWTSIFRNAAGIIFLATPHQVPSSATGACFHIRSVLLPTPPLLRLLRSKSLLLDQIAGRFNNIWPRRIFSFRETKAKFGFGIVIHHSMFLHTFFTNSSCQIVSRRDAIANYVGEVIYDVLNCDHTGICKPASVDSPLFTELLVVIQVILQEQELAAVRATAQIAQVRGAEPEVTALAAQARGAGPEVTALAAQARGAGPEVTAPAAQARGAGPEVTAPAAQASGAGPAVAAPAAQARGAGPEVTAPAAQARGAGPEVTALAAQARGAGPEVTAPAAQARGAGLEATALAAQSRGAGSEVVAQAVTAMVSAVAAMVAAAVAGAMAPAPGRENHG